MVEAGSVWLRDLPDVIDSWGIPVDVYDENWETRARSSGGYDKVLAIGIHHDASGAGSSDAANEDYCWRNSGDRPIGCMRLRRSGVVIVGAAGATNTMGKGGPLTCSKGTVPKDAGNKYMIAIEAANNGAGEAWPSIMIDNYIALVAALCDAYDLDASRDIFTHHSYCQPSCPGRKVDPAGPTPSEPSLGGTSGVAIWNHDDVRALVLDRLDHSVPHPPEPSITEEERMLGLVRLDSNPNAIYVTDGINARKVRSDEVDELTSNLAYDTGFRYYDLTSAGRPQIRDINKIPQRSDDQIQLWGIETTESTTQPG